MADPSCVWNCTSTVSVVWDSFTMLNVTTPSASFTVYEFGWNSTTTTHSQRRKTCQWMNVDKYLHNSNQILQINKIVCTYFTYTGSMHILTFLWQGLLHINLNVVYHSKHTPILSSTTIHIRMSVLALTTACFQNTNVSCILCDNDSLWHSSDGGCELFYALHYIVCCSLNCHCL